MNGAGKAASVVMATLLAGALGTTGLMAQGPDGRWPLQPTSGVGRVVAPFLEGWYVNDDGTVSYSFGYLNRNDSTVQLPLGPLNSIEPAQFHGMQPTEFLPGRHRGMFAVTVPASMRTSDVWWTLTNPDGKVTKVPGRSSWSAYMLDWVPRPHGTVPPEVAFEGGQRSLGGPGRGPIGVMAERSISTSVGAVTELSANVRELSERDRTDPRFREPTPLHVVWSAYQAPLGARVEFSRHASTPPDPPRDPAPGGAEREPEGPEAITISSGVGTARVNATFSMPGEYLMNVQVDNFSAPDSQTGDQCCWTNGYVRVTVR